MGLLAILLALLASQDGPVRVTVQTKDGNTLRGTTDVRSFVVESSTEKVTVTLKNVMMIRMQEATAAVGLWDRSVLKGKISPESWKVTTSLGDFTVKLSDIKTLAVIPSGPPPLPRTVTPPAERRPPGLPPVKTLALGVPNARTARSPDGKKLYLLDAARAEVRVVNLERFEQEIQISLARGEKMLSLSPSGNVLLVAGAREAAILTSQQGKQIATFSLQHEIVDVCLIDDRTALVAKTPAGLVLISVQDGRVIAESQGYLPGPLLLSRDGRRVHSGDSIVTLPDMALDGNEIAMSEGFGRSLGHLVMSPDGRYAASSQGNVFRLGKSFAAPVVRVVDVEPHLSAAWVEARKRLCVITPEGQVNEYDTEKWERVKSWWLGHMLTCVTADASGSHLVGLVHPTGDLLKFEVPK